jgi:hypothetical protein
VKADGDTALPVSTLTTATSTAPALADGVTTESCVAVRAVTVPATPPKVTVAPGSNSVPVMVTLVPPFVVPEAGCTDVIVGLDGVAV